MAKAKWIQRSRWNFWTDSFANYRWYFPDKANFIPSCRPYWGCRAALCSKPCNVDCRSPFYIAQFLGVWCAMTSNFALNNILTYRDRMLRGVSWVSGLLSFYVVCFFGALANVGVAELLFETYPNWLLASFVGAVVGALWNFMTSARVTWRVR